MTFTEAMDLVKQGKAVFSKFAGGTVVHMPGRGETVFVPRITNAGSIMPITPLSAVLCGAITGALDWELSGVAGGQTA